jgi:hypothetical protein
VIGGDNSTTNGTIGGDNSTVNGTIGGNNSTLNGTVNGTVNGTANATNGTAVNGTDNNSTLNGTNSTLNGTGSGSGISIPLLNMSSSSYQFTFENYAVPSGCAYDTDSNATISCSDSNFRGCSFSFVELNEFWDFSAQTSCSDDQGTLN